MNSQMANLLLQAASDPRVQRAAKQQVAAAGRGLQKFAFRERAPRARQRRKAQAPFNRRMVQRAPVALSRPMGVNAGDSNNARVSRGREFIGDLMGSSSSTPAVVTYLLNPGNSTSFPRLSQEANVWEQYHFRKLKVIYTPAVSTATGGTIVLTPEFNANQTPPTTESGLLNHQGSKSGAPWADLEIILPASNMHGNAYRKYIRDGTVVGDLNTYDAGQLHVAGVSNGGTGVMGKLWMEYEIEFYVPQVEPATVIPRSVSFWGNTGNQTIVTTVEEPVEYDNETVNALQITTSDNLNFIAPKGAYLVMAYFEVENSLAATSMTLQGYIRKDGVVQSQSVDIYEAAIAGDNRRAMLIYGIVYSLGYEEIQVAIEATAAGGGGTLEVKGDTAKLLFMSV